MKMQGHHWMGAGLIAVVFFFLGVWYAKGKVAL